MATKNNDPAFLFYSKDFYEGTRTMLPEERACYMDLLIYQHQHGLIPLDLKRLQLYCSGIAKATLIATLEAKFEATDEGYVNKKLCGVIEQRAEFSNKQSINGSVGQFFKKAKGLLSREKYATLKQSLSNKTNKEIFDIVSGREIDKAMLEAMLIALLKHLEDEDANEDIEDTIESKGGVGESAEPQKTGEQKPGSEYSVEFEMWWNLYDKKVGDKKKLMAKWRKIPKRDIGEIFRHTKDYVRATPDKKFRKNPQTYLNNESWNDEIIESNGKTNRTDNDNAELGQRLAETAIRLEYERYDGGEQTAEEFERRIGFKPVQRHLRNA